MSVTSIHGPANGSARFQSVVSPSAKSEEVVDVRADESSLNTPAIEVPLPPKIVPTAVQYRRPLESRRIVVSAFSDTQRERAKAAFTTRRVPVDAMRTLVSGPIRPRSGDLVLARIDKIRNLSRIELASGRKASLHVGDEIVVAYGDRYATDLCESHVPENLNATSLIASGGLASSVISRTRGTRSATEITPVGLVGDERGKPLNLMQFALQPVKPEKKRPRTIAVLGTSMNSGKTTTNRFLVSGLSRAGLKPGATKVTGTGSGGDYWIMIDAGAHCVLDFTDVGFSSTYRIPLESVEMAMTQLIDHLTNAGCGVIMVEIADGLFQEQNSKLIRSEFFKDCIDGVLFAAGEAMGAAMGVAQLQQIGLPVLGVSGRLTASELLIREARAACAAPVFTKEDLGNPEIAASIVGIDPETLEESLTLAMVTSPVAPETVVDLGFEQEPQLELEHELKDGQFVER